MLNLEVQSLNRHRKQSNLVQISRGQMHSRSPHLLTGTDKSSDPESKDQSEGGGGCRGIETGDAHSLRAAMSLFAVVGWKSEGETTHT